MGPTFHVKHPPPPAVVSAAKTRVLAWLNECARQGLTMPPDAQRRAWDSAIQTESDFQDRDQPPPPEV